MTSEELLNPRYKVIANYPDCPFNIGAILTLTTNNLFFIDASTTKMYYPSISVDDIRGYPQIFKELAWWEERDIKDLPKFVKHLHSGQIHEVGEWLIKNDCIYSFNSLDYEAFKYLIPVDVEE